jgi:hypothetical protein
MRCPSNIFSFVPLSIQQAVCRDNLKYEERHKHGGKYKREVFHVAFTSIIEAQRITFLNSQWLLFDSDNLQVVSTL